MTDASIGTAERQAPQTLATGAPNDDRDIVARMAAGDPRALGELYDRFSAVAHALALRIVGDPDEADDVVEDAFWQLWRQAARFDATRGSVGTWVATVTRSRALDRRRALARHSSTADHELDPARAAVAPGDASPAADPAEAAEAQERRALVTSALQGLPADQRRVVELAYFQGLSQSDIAEQTGEPLGTIKTRIRLAMQKLRVRLAMLHPEAT